MVLIRTVAERQWVTCACPAAIAAGVRVGMTLAHARALIADHRPQIAQADDARDAAAMRALAHWLTRYLPRVAPDETAHGLLADVTGCQRLYHGERRLLAKLQHALGQFNLTARLAIAPTFGTAWALSHHADDNPVIIKDDIEAAIAPLPLAALRIDKDDIDGLTQVGVQTIGQLLALPRAALPSRFSDELIWRIDLAMGRAIETIDPVRPKPIIEATRTFAGPATQFEAIVITVEQLIDSLCEQLQSAESGAQRFRLTLERYRGEPVVIEVPASRPCRSARHLRTLIGPHVERANLGHGVEHLTLRAIDPVRIAHQQLGPRDPDAQADRAFGELLDTLGARLGDQRISAVQAIETHIPERVFRRLPHRDATGATTTAAVTDHPRPSHLIHPPRPVRVMSVSPDGPVLGLQWQGEQRTITTSHGPERICGQWWRADRFVRDYFRVQDDTGQWWWLFRDHAGLWFLHGMWV